MQGKNSHETFESYDIIHDINFILKLFNNFFN